jgi:hypothetical protein
MLEPTYTMAGLLAVAGVARLFVGASASCATRTAVAAAYGAPAHQVSGSHHLTSWISGALVKPATVMVFIHKNRPTRPLSELSP